MKDPDNIDWEREGCTGCKQAYCTPRYYRLDNGDPVDLTHEDVEHARAEIHLEHHFWHVPSFKRFAWEDRLEEEHPLLYLGLHFLYAAVIFALIIGLAVIA